MARHDSFRAWWTYWDRNASESFNDAVDDLYGNRKGLTTTIGLAAVTMLVSFLSSDGSGIEVVLAFLRAVLAVLTLLAVVALLRHMVYTPIKSASGAASLYRQELDDKDEQIRGLQDVISQQRAALALPERKRDFTGTQFIHYLVREHKSTFEEVARVYLDVVQHAHDDKIKLWGLKQSSTTYTEIPASLFVDYGLANFSVSLAVSIQSGCNDKSDFDIGAVPQAEVGGAKVPSAIRYRRVEFAEAEVRKYWPPR